MGRLLSVNVGMPKPVDWNGRTVYTGIWKQPVSGPRRARRLNLDGDGQGDTAGHGGEMRAVLVYQLESYRYWGRYLGRDDFGYGQFGENFTVDGLPDDEVCIGDRYRIGDAEFEVTQPRVTCYRVGLRLDRPDMAALLVGHHRPGFYLRVITEGEVEAGDEIVRTVTGRHRITVTAVDALLYLPGRDPDLMRRALDVPALSPGWQGSFRELLDAGDRPPTAAGPAPVPPAWTGFRRLRVARVVPETATVTSIYLTADDGTPLPAARAGQYLTLRVPGAAEPPPVRSYSLSAAPTGGGYRLSVKREAHGLVSAYLNTVLQPGAQLDAAAPRGEFVLDDGTGPVLLVSGGIGVTPVLAMLYQLAADRTDREVWWIHGAHDPAEQPLGAEAHALLGRLTRAHEHIYYSTGPGGRLSADKLAALRLPADATAYVCGPAGFMAAMTAALTTVGIPPARVHTELFGALGPINPGLADRTTVPPHPPVGPPGTGPLLTFARSGLSVPFDPARGSILEMAESCDVPTRWSCRTGVCHTCATPLLSGQVDYSPDPLEPPDRGEALICCARPATELVLDL